MRVRIGRVGRPHGNGGMFHVSEMSERTSLLGQGRSVWVGERALTVARRGGTAARPLLKLEGVDTRAAAEALAGAAITVPREQIGPLDEREHLVDDLISCEVRAEGRPIGRVRDVLTLPSVDVLEVSAPSGETVLVPLVEDAVQMIDVERRRIDVNPGFLQLPSETA